MTNKDWENYMKGEETKEYVIKRFKRLGFKVVEPKTISLADSEAVTSDDLIQAIRMLRNGNE